MKLRNLVIGCIVSLILIIIVFALLIIVGPNIKKHNNVSSENTIVEEETKNNEEILIATLERKKEEIKEQPQFRDAATVTQEIQEKDMNIGKLFIPKTELNTAVYSKQDADKMEEVPCMLYTNEGPNKPGVTILVGHNRANGTLFSDNNKLEENDEFYFTDIDGNEKKYAVISKFIAKNDDVSFYNMPSDKPIIGMQCCLTPTDSENVLIIMARAEN